MLFLVGIGLKPSHLTQEALETLKSSDRVYLENYTSAYSEGNFEALEDMIGKAATRLERKQVEEEFAPILEEAKTKNIALAVFGNPLNATTHVQILLDAKEAGVKTRAIAGVSIFEYVSFTGLERYKFGRTTSIVFHEDEYAPESFYDAIIENKKAGLHTLCLLDIRSDENRMMDIRHAISLLESIEEKREQSALSDTIMVGIAGAGSGDEQIKAGTAEHLKAFAFGPFPQALIVCGKLNEKEIEALKAFGGLQ